MVLSGLIELRFAEKIRLKIELGQKIMTKSPDPVSLRVINTTKVIDNFLAIVVVYYTTVKSNRLSNEY
jgi:hypothetical protein